MPSGYTAPVMEGKQTTLEQFALNCARAFGALISLRDEPNNTPIPEEIKPSPYHKDMLKKAKKELKGLEKMTVEEAQVHAEEEYIKRQKDLENSIKESQAITERYATMLEKVKSWQPPTEEHQGLKKFMIEQLTESIKWDNSGDYHQEEKARPMLTGQQWLDREIASLKKDLVYHSEHYAKDVKGAANKTKWLKELRKSLR